MSSPTQSTLLALPTELQLMILSYLTSPERQMLRSTSTYFASLIPSPTMTDLLTIEKSPYNTRHFSLCFTCRKLQPRTTWLGGLYGNPAPPPDKMIDASGWPVETHFFCGECKNCTRALSGSEEGNSYAVERRAGQRLLVDTVPKARRRRLSQRVLERANLPDSIKINLLQYLEDFERQDLVNDQVMIYST